MEADFLLDYDVLSLGSEHRLYLLARIKAGPPPADDQRRPLNLSVVLDRSGSMAGDKLDYVKQATQFLVRRLGAEDRFSLVTYNHQVSVTIPPTTAANKDAINKAIDGITSGGNTNLSGGWLQGCQLVSEGMAEGQVNRVLLLTDGLANEGVTDAVRLAAMVRQKRAEGVTTTTMGVGMNFNEDLLVRMASEGGGAFYFIDDPDQAPGIFSEELQDLMNVVGQNVTLTVRPSPDVIGVQQIADYPHEQRDGEIVFRLGDLYADEIKRQVLELSLPAIDSQGEVEVAQLRFDYDELAEDSVTHQMVELPLIVKAIPEADLEVRLPDPEVMKAALLLRAARAREQAIEHADRGEFSEAARILNEMADAIEATGLDDEQLQAEHDLLREEAVNMDLGEQRYDAHMRKASFTSIGHALRHERHLAQTLAVTDRFRESVPALERGGETPTVIKWKRESLPLDTDLLRIGRSNENDIAIDNEKVSKRHCQIERAGDDLFLVDLNSMNGTFANGGRVGSRFRLSVGDVMTVGELQFRFE